MCKLVEKENSVYAYTEYNVSFVSAARKMGGKWIAENKSWKFPVDIKQEVENVLIDFFGYGQEKINIEVEYNPDNNTIFNYQNIEFFGKKIFSRRYRDSEVSVHPDVSIISGSFSGSGGSMKYPCINEPKGKLVFIVRNVPKNLLHEIPDSFTWKERENSVPKSKYADFTIQQLKEMKAEIEKELEGRIK